VVGKINAQIEVPAFLREKVQLNSAASTAQQSTSPSPEDLSTVAAVSETYSHFFRLPYSKRKQLEEFYR